MKKSIRDTVKWLRGKGCSDVTVEPGGKHPKLCFNHDGRHHRVPVPSSPSDVRGIRNRHNQLEKIMGLR